MSSLNIRCSLLHGAGRIIVGVLAVCGSIVIAQANVEQTSPLTIAPPKNPSDAVAELQAGLTAAENAQTDMGDAIEKLRPYKSLTLESKGCYGTCPVYRVTFYGTGRAHLDALNFVPRKGSFEGRLNQYEFEKLCLAFERLGFAQMKPKYLSVMTDEETIVVSAETDSGIKTVVDYGPSGPLELSILELLLANAKDSVRWRETEAQGAKSDDVHFHAREMTIPVSDSAGTPLCYLRMDSVGGSFQSPECQKAQVEFLSGSDRRGATLDVTNVTYTVATNQLHGNGDLAFSSREATINSSYGRYDYGLKDGKLLLQGNFEILVDGARIKGSSAEVQFDVIGKHAILSGFSIEGLLAIEHTGHSDAVIYRVEAQSARYSLGDSNIYLSRPAFFIKEKPTKQTGENGAEIAVNLATFDSSAPGSAK